MQRFQRSETAIDFVDLGAIQAIVSGDSGEWSMVLLSGGDVQVNLPSWEINRLRQEYLDRPIELPE